MARRKQKGGREKPHHHRRNDDLRRREAFREPLPWILVVCEGTVTEPSYLHDFKSDQKNGLVDVEAIGLGQDPKSLVDEAINRKRNAAAGAVYSHGDDDSDPGYDEVWCLFDVDGEPRKRRVPEAKQAARNEGIKLGISDPSFELWALLHFEEFNRPSTQAEVRKALKNTFQNTTRFCHTINLLRDMWMPCRMRDVFAETEVTKEPQTVIHRRR
jgi:hypothetical protein